MTYIKYIVVFMVVYAILVYTFDMNLLLSGDTVAILAGEALRAFLLGNLFFVISRTLQSKEAAN